MFYFDGKEVCLLKNKKRNKACDGTLNIYPMAVSIMRRGHKAWTSMHKEEEETRSAEKGALIVQSRQHTRRKGSGDS
jgi:hypothetical protein